MLLLYRGQKQAARLRMPSAETVVKVVAELRRKSAGVLLHLAAPRLSNPFESLTQLPELDQQTFELLFDELFEFFKAKHRPEGLRDIFLAYQRWLRKHSWYTTDHPDWREPA